MASTIKLGEAATFVNGYPFKPETWTETGLPIIRIQNLNNPEAPYNHYSGPIPEKYVVRQGDILISWSASLGAYEWKGEDAYLNQHIFKVVFDKCPIDKHFLRYAVESKLAEMEKDAHGATMRHIVKKDFDNTLIPYPSIAEQETIVAELDCLTGIIEKKKQQLEELDKLAQSIFYDMFGDPYEQSYNYKPLDTFCKIVGRIGFRGYTRDDFVETAKDGAISLSPSNIVNGDMDYSKCSYITWSKYNQSPEIMIANGDILVVKTGSSYGKVAMVKNLPHQASINPQFVVLKDIRCNRLFLEYYLKTPFARDKYEEFVIGTAIPTFSQKKLGSLPVVNYPLDLQNDFAKKIEAIEKQKELVKRSIVETEILFNSRMDFWFNN